MFDLSALRLVPGSSEQTTVEAEAPLYRQAGVEYVSSDDPVPVKLRVSRYEDGWELAMSAGVTLTGACSRCLSEATLPLELEAHEIHEPQADDPELTSDWVNARLELDLAGWVQSSVALAFPHRVLCREDCKGLCPNCGTNWNLSDCDCEVESGDSRWDKLREISFDDSGGTDDD